MRFVKQTAPSFYVNHCNRVSRQLSGNLLGVRQESTAEGAHARDVRGARGLVYDEHRLLRSLPGCDSISKPSRRVDRSVQHAEVEGQAAHENARTRLVERILQQTLLLTPPIHHYFDRLLVQHGESVGLTVQTLGLGRRLQVVAVAPLALREFRTEALLARGLEVGEGAEALVIVLNALVSDDDARSVPPDLRQLRGNHRVELPRERSPARPLQIPSSPAHSEEGTRRRWW